jgi:TonB family protein
MAAFANRTRNRRYGHLKAYRTKLVVTEVDDVKSVPEAVPWPSARSTKAGPVVRRAEVPQYPEMAWNVGITGDVVIDVEVSGGQVAKAEVRSGDRMLAGEAVRNVKTWQFATGVSASFTTTFSFNVETRNTGESTSARIELDLPERVRITAARNGW